jgi:hypothetical protein
VLWFTCRHPNPGKKRVAQPPRLGESAAEARGFGDCNVYSISNIANIRNSVTISLNRGDSSSSSSVTCARPARFYVSPSSSRNKQFLNYGRQELI